MKIPTPMRRRSWFFPLLVFAAYGQAAAQQEEAGSITIEQFLAARSISDVRISPDQAHVAFTVTEPVKGIERNRDVWVYSRDLQKAIRFTTSAKADYQPRFSPLGGEIAFLSDRDETTQIHLIPLDGGESRALTKSETSIGSYEWSPDGKAIAYLAPEPKTEEEEKREEEKDDPRIADRNGRQARIWVIDVESSEVRQLTHGDWRVSEYAWMPDGHRLILLATDHPKPELETARLYELSVADGKMSEIARPSLPVGRLQVSPDGRNISWAGSRSDGPIPHDLFVLPVAGSEPRNLTALSIDRSLDGYVWLDEESVLVQVSDGFATVFYTVSVQGKSVKRPGFEVEPSGSFFARNGTLAFVGETATAAPELWMSEESGEARPITELNSDWDLPLIQPRLFRYQSFDGTSIEAALLMPDGAREGVRLPLVVLVHGGPTGRWRSSVNAWGQLLAARGIAVLYPNIRGSTGYGHDLLTANHRDWGGGDFKDVMAGIDYLIEEGTADPDRLGIGGWSYGGYMAAWAVTQTDRFKASVSGAPMTDLAFEYGSETARINAYDSWFLGTPYENLDLFIERSPVTHVRNVKTPTLLLCAENDVIDPVEQCQQFYRGLRRYDVETSYVVYPREGHGIREEKHTIDLANRLVEWFVRYLEP